MTALPGLRPAWLSWRLVAASLPFVVGGLLSVFFIWQNIFTIAGHRYLVLYDDAMISMRYARNLAAGYGLVWNPGQPAVEGYSNFLWTLWMALPHAIGIDESKASLFVSASGVPILLANALVVWAIGRRLAPAAPAVAQIATWLSVLAFPLLFWTLTGLEVGLLALLTSTAVLLALRLRERWSRRELIGLAGLLSALLLTRTDQVVTAAIVAGFVVATAAGSRRAWSAGVLWAGVVGTLAAHTAFRVLYYGEPLPNTYYLKVEGVPVVTRLLRGALALASIELTFLCLPVALAVAAFVLHRRQVRGAMMLLAAVFVGECAYSVYVGGDAWEWYSFPNRFLTPGLPALLLLSALGVQAIRRASPKIAGWTLGAILVGCGAELLLWRRVVELVGDPQALPTIGMLYVDDGGNAERRVAALGLAAAITAGLLVLGIASSVRPSALPGRVLGAITLVGLTLALFAASSGPVFTRWLIRNSTTQFSTIEAYSRLALALRQATAPDASIAVVWAGAIPYFDQRPAVDLLGRSDAIIAHETSSTRFWPGHSKSDRDYSLGELKPDLVVQLAYGPEAELNVKGVLYRRVLPTLYVRSDSTRVDLLALERVVCALAPDDRLESWSPGTWLWDWQVIYQSRCATDPLSLR